MVLRPLIKLLSPDGRRGRLSILVLHRVLAQPDPMYPEAIDAAQFDSICSWLRSMFTVLPLDAAVLRLKNGTLPAAAMAITFDDGYVDNLQVATPVLQRHGLCATVFVASGFVDGGCMWNDAIIESIRCTHHTVADFADVVPDIADKRFDLSGPPERRRAVETIIDAVKYLPPGRRNSVVEDVASKLGVTPPTDLMLTQQGIRDLHRGGMQIGAHTITHPILMGLTREAMHEEIDGGRRYLEGVLDERVGVFAYPNGQPGEDYDRCAVDLVRDLGFDAAVTTVKGAASANSDALQLPRFTPWDRTPWRFGVRMALNLLQSDGRVPSEMPNRVDRSPIQPQ